jgi:hypothetical protein
MNAPEDITAAANAFAAVAGEYVRWLDQAVTDEAPAISMRKLHELLGLLQAAAAQLPAMGPGDEADDDAEYEHIPVAGITRKLPVDVYAVVFDPFEYAALEVNPPKPVMATIADDLSDIYGDLMEGLAMYRAGHIQRALWHWHFTYYTHWGRHLSHGQSAIWQYLSQGNWL